MPGIFNADIFNNSVFNTGALEEELKGRKRLRRRAKYGRRQVVEESLSVVVFDPEIQKLAEEAADKLLAAGQELALAKQELEMAKTSERMAAGRKEFVANLEAKVAAVEARIKKLRQEEAFIYVLALAI